MKFSMVKSSRKRCLVGSMVFLKHTLRIRSLILAVRNVGSVEPLASPAGGLRPSQPLSCRVTASFNRTLQAGDATACPPARAATR